MLPISLTHALRIAQLETLPMVYGGIATTEIRCRFAQLISEILPGDLNGVLFPLGGAKKRHMAKVRGTQGTTFRKRQRKCFFFVFRRRGKRDSHTHREALHGKAQRCLLKPACSVHHTLPTPYPHPTHTLPTPYPHRTHTLPSTAHPTPTLPPPIHFFQQCSRITARTTAAVPTRSAPLETFGAAFLGVGVGEGGALASLCTSSRRCRSTCRGGSKRRRRVQRRFKLSRRPSFLKVTPTK